MKPPSDGASEPKYVDRPEVDEVFADRLEHLSFDGVSVRMEFTVIRTEPQPTARAKATPERKRWSYTAARIVLSPLGAAEMLNKMQELQRVLLEHGVVQPTGPQAAAGAPLSPSRPSS
jgi:hypothetical protein